MSEDTNEHARRRHDERRTRSTTTRSASRSSASATAPTPSSRASSTTRTPTPPSRSRASCTSTSAATTSATSSSPPPSTSTPRRSARTSPRRSGRARTTRSSSPTCPKLGVEVHRGMTHDGLGKYLKEKITKAPGETADIVGILKETQDRRRSSATCRSAPSRRPSGTSSRRSRPACGFVNCLPVFIAREDYWDKRFEEAGLPIIGDDIKSQVGATIVHRQLARLFHDRGVRCERTSAAQRRRQHGLLQHARARAAGVEEDLEDQRRHLDHGPRAARGRRLHRPVGLRAVADRPQVGAHPARGPGRSATCR